MSDISRKTVFSSLLVSILVISACSKIQEPAPDPTRDLRPGPVATPVSTQASPPGISAETPSLEAAASAITSTLPTTATIPASCPPTPPDALGPFYKPGAPVRNKVGEGYVLSGVVRSSEGCTPIPDAQIEVWMAGPDGNYTDDYRATLFSDENGIYRFESHFPPPYSGRPPHIHLQVSSTGYQTLVTQHYPAQGQTGATFDIVLIPNQ